MGKFYKLLGIILAFGLLSTTHVFAKYKEGAVSNGGTISGKVSFKGAQPGPKEFDIGKFPQSEFCSNVDTKDGKRLRQDVRVNGGGLGDAVVFIQKIESGKAFEKIEAKFVADGCRFLVAEGEGPSRAVTIVVNAKKTGKKATFKIKNLDADPSDPKTAEGILHNPHGYDVKGFLTKTVFNKPIPKKDQEITLKVKKTWFKKSNSFMKIECDQHNYMNVWALPVTNPYFAIVSDDGSYTIGDVPPGKYELKAFHQALGFKKMNIEVSGGGTAKGDFEFGG